MTVDLIDCMTVDLIDDFFAKLHQRQAGQTRSIPKNEVIEAIAKTLVFDCEFRREDAAARTAPILT